MIRLLFKIQTHQTHFPLSPLSTLVILLILGMPHPSWAAHTHDHTHQELEEIKQRLKVIELETDRRRITGAEERKEFKDKTPESEENYPILSSQKTRLSGGLTFILQGVTNNERQFGGNRADGSLSIDLILESEIRHNGLLIVRGDFMRGDGLSRLPDIFAGGVNADVENFKNDGSFANNPDSFHLIEALYEQTWKRERYRLSFGQIDLTSYFDQNEFANSETFQFISPLFVNNIAIDWGGDANGYGPGLLLHAHPFDMLEFNLGFFEGDGNYTDMIDQPFWIIEIEYERYQRELEGHYRFIYWSNETIHPSILNTSVAISGNTGFALSFDQALTQNLGLWGRFGTQDGEVSNYDLTASGGFQFNELFGREGTTLGIAFGMSFISDGYKQSSSLDKDETITEVYYNIKTAHGIHISPDVQHITHPGGDGTIAPITIYGLRAQIVF